MRNSIVLATLLVFGLGSAPAAAQTFGFGAHAGVSVPTGSYADDADLGFMGGVDLWYPLAMAGGALSWYSSVDAIAHSVDIDDADTGFLYVPVMTGLRFDVPVGPIGAFATGQLGVVLTRGPSDVTVGPITYDSSDWGTDFGFNVGGGLQLTNNIYAGAKYYPLGDVNFEGATDPSDVSFLDIYIGFGVR